MEREQIYYVWLDPYTRPYDMARTFEGANSAFWRLYREAGYQNIHDEMLIERRDSPEGLWQFQSPDGHVWGRIIPLPQHDMEFYEDRVAAEEAADDDDGIPF